MCRWRILSAPSAHTCGTRLLAHLLESAASNARHHDRVALFSIDKVYLASEDGPLPDEPRRLTIVLTGAREPESWHRGSVRESDRTAMDFYDLKGVIEAVLAGLHITSAKFEPIEHPTYYPGRTARLSIGERVIGTLGEVHPLVREAFDFPEQPVLACELDFEALLTCDPGRLTHHRCAALPGDDRGLGVDCR